MTSRHAAVTVDGLTHASSVIPVVSRNDAESGTITRALVPLKVRALPYLPSVVHAAFPVLPVFPFPDVSATVVPALLRLLDRRPESGRYRAADLSDADRPATTESTAGSPA